MPAWPVVNKWTERFIQHYQQRARARAQWELDRRARFTCEDLALHVIIRFADHYRLPVTIRNEWEPRGYDPRDFDGTADEFRAQVLSTTGARDFVRFTNTQGFRGTRGSMENLGRARPGDLIHLVYPDYDHIQLVTEATPQRITIVQGNIDDWGRTSADPSSEHYIGAVVQEHYYDGEGYCSRPRRDGERPRTFQEHQGRVRRRNFEGWNCKRV
ncbi:MAG TPA: hypothetical protein VFF45_00765 [Bacilli bacterium]|jgi:hypothetical protein|nr:hypothetical protein [Bacilli bacterium]